MGPHQALGRHGASARLKRGSLQLCSLRVLALSARCGQSARVRGSGVRRAARALVIVLASGSLLTACSPDDITGVKLSDAGRPILVNCGAYFLGVKVSDADTAREVWTAGKSPGSSEYGVGEIAVGVVPESDWTASALHLQPTPSNWRFVITRLGYDEPLTLTVANADLSVDEVFIPDSGKKVAADTFIGKTCGYDPPIPRASQRVMIILFGVAAVPIAVVLVGRNRRRRQREAA